MVSIVMVITAMVINHMIIIIIYNPPHQAWAYKYVYNSVMNLMIINHMIGIIIYHDDHLKPTMLSSWRDLKMLFSSLHWLHKDWMHTMPET